MIKVACTSCGKSVKTTDAWAGRTAKCPNCNARIVFPAVDETSAEPDAPTERDAAGARGEKAAGAVKSPARGAASASPTTTSAPPARKCPCCGKSTPAEVATCVHCGEFLGVATKPSRAGAPGNASAHGDEEFEEPASPGANLLARLAGVLMAVMPIGGFVYDAKTKTTDNAASPIMITSLLALAILGIPGVYIAIKGALGGDAARANRARGIVQFVSGIGMIIAGGLMSIAITWIGWLLGIFSVVLIGLVGTGAVTAALGFVSIISGRNLVAEMSQKDLF